MSDKILWLHHFEPYWESSLQNEGTSFQEEMVKVLDYVENEEPDQIIITLFEDFNLSHEHIPLVELCNELGIHLEYHTYGYAWRREKDEEYDLETYPEEKLGETWCYGTRDYHSEEDVIELTEWQHRIKESGASVLLGGAFVNECLSDAEAALEALDIPYNNVDELQVGSCVQYNFRGPSPEHIEGEVNDVISKYDNEIYELLYDNNLSNFKDGIEVNPKLYMDYSEELNQTLMEYINKLQHIEISTNYAEIDALFDKVKCNGEECEELYFLAEDAMRKQLFTKFKSGKEKYYHGTHINCDDEDEIENNVLDGLSTSYSDLDVVYISNSEGATEFFTTWKANDTDNSISVILEIELELGKVYEWDTSMSRTIETDHGEYDIGEREELYRALDGEYNAFIIKDNYPEHGGDDIAYFSDISPDNISRAKLKINGEWTDWQSIDQCRDQIKEYTNNLENPRNKMRRA